MRHSKTYFGLKRDIDATRLRVWLKRRATRPVLHNPSLLQHQMLADIRFGQSKSESLNLSTYCPLFTP
jgi:hypothetical protein